MNKNSKLFLALAVLSVMFSSGAFAQTEMQSTTKRALNTGYGNDQLKLTFTNRTGVDLPATEQTGQFSPPLGHVISYTG